MSTTEQTKDTSVFGVHACGCITFWCGTPSDMDKATKADLMEYVIDGGQIVHGSLDEMRDLPEFMPSECPHEPKGWERTPEPDPNAVAFRFERAYDHARYKGTTWHLKRKNRFYWCYTRAGQVFGGGKSWYGTTGYFDEGAITAHRWENEPSWPVHGPFASKKEAGKHIADLWNAEEIVKGEARAAKAAAESEAA